MLGKCRTLWQKCRDIIK